MNQQVKIKGNGMTRQFSTYFHRTFRDCWPWVFLNIPVRAMLADYVLLNFFYVFNYKNVIMWRVFTLQDVGIYG
jgi:hypothetical protein